MQRKTFKHFLQKTINTHKNNPNSSHNKLINSSKTNSSIINFARMYLPKRIILCRHGETQFNEDENVLEYVPNHMIKLTKIGSRQAQISGSKIREIVCENRELSSNCKMLFYVSPTSRTRETMKEIMETFPKEKVVGVREECRLREQNFGNYMDAEKRKKLKSNRISYGKFFYRVPDGESSADVYDRVSTFVEALWRDMENNKVSTKDPSDELNLIIVSHGYTILLFLMKWFNWTVDQFEDLTNPTYCEYRILQLGPSGEYSLAIHHHLDELKAWGLSQDMIDDQITRASGSPN